MSRLSEEPPTFPPPLSLMTFLQTSSPCLVSRPSRASEPVSESAAPIRSVPPVAPPPLVLPVPQATAPSATARISTDRVRHRIADLPPSSGPTARSLIYVQIPDAILALARVCVSQGRPSRSPGALVIAARVRLLDLPVGQVEVVLPALDQELAGQHPFEYGASGHSGEGARSLPRATGQVHPDAQPHVERRASA